VLPLLPAAVALTAPQPAQLIPDKPVITFRDYPTEAMQQQAAGIVSVKAMISIEGRVSACVVTESSGSTILDRKSCALLKARGRFQPARDAEGRPVEGEYRAAFAWGIDANQPKSTLDITLMVAKLPANYRHPIKTQAVFGGNGRAISCTIRETSGAPVADKAACTYILEQLAIPNARGGQEGEPPAAVRYIIATLKPE
jgi:TonB family protein